MLLQLAPKGLVIIYDRGDPRKMTIYNKSIWMEEYSNLASSGWKKIFSYFQTKIFFNGTIGPPSYTDTITIALDLPKVYLNGP